MSVLTPQALELIRCPVTRSRLTPGDEALLQALNQRITDGQLVNRIGQAVTDPVEAVMVNADGDVACAVRQGIVQLIGDETLVIPEDLRATGANRS